MFSNLNLYNLIYNLYVKIRYIIYKSFASFNYKLFKGFLFTLISKLLY